MVKTRAHKLFPIRSYRSFTFGQIEINRGTIFKKFQKISRCEDRSKIVKRRIDRENEKLCQFDADSEASETENDVYKCEIKKVKKTLLKKNTSRFRRK